MNQEKWSGMTNILLHFILVFVLCASLLTVFFPFIFSSNFMTYKKFIHFPIPIFFVPFYRIAFALSLLLYLICFLMSVLSLSLFVKGQTVFRSRNIANDICVMLY